MIIRVYVTCEISTKLTVSEFVASYIKAPTDFLQVKSHVWLLRLRLLSRKSPYTTKISLAIPHFKYRILEFLFFPKEFDTSRLMTGFKSNSYFGSEINKVDSYLQPILLSQPSFDSVNRIYSVR